MDKEQLIMKTGQVLQPLETQNVMAFIRKMEPRSILNNPLISFLLFLLLIYALWRWARIVLLSLFTLISLAALIRYTLPSGTELTIASTFPFFLGCLGIGTVLLYFAFIRTD
jgi:hypothetical protein